MQKFVQWGQRQLDFTDLKNYKLPSNGQQRSWNRTSWNTADPRYSDNPYWTVYENTSEDQRDRFYGSVQLKYDLAPGLYAVGNIYGDHYTFNMSSRVAIGSQAVSKYEESRRAMTEMNYEGRLHYDKKIDWFSLNSFVGANRMHRKTDAIDAATKGGLVVPRLYSLNNGMEGAKIVEFRTKKRINSMYGTVSLGFKDLVFLEGTARNDWSSTLPEGNRSYFYPSVTGSLVFSQLVKAQWLNFGKLRAGWSKVGNDTEPYNLINTYVNNNVDNASLYDDPTFMGIPWYLNPTTLKNDELKPESKKTWEIGLEMSMLRNRVAFDVTYYTETTTDLIMPVQFNAGTGYRYRMLNAGEMRNRGVEALLNLIPVRTEDFEWGMSFNFSKNSNKLVALTEGISSLFLFNVTLVAMVGERYGQLRGTDFVYDDNGNKVVGENGLYEASEIKNLGSVLPDYNLGIRQNFSYKNISISALIDIQKGGKFFSTSNMWGHYSGMLSATAANGVRENGIVSDGVVKNITTNPDGSQTISYVKNKKEVSAQSYFVNYYTGPDAQNVFDADYINRGHHLGTHYLFM